MEPNVDGTANVTSIIEFLRDLASGYDDLTAERTDAFAELGQTWQCEWEKLLQCVQALAAMRHSQAEEFRTVDLDASYGIGHALEIHARWDLQIEGALAELDAIEARLKTSLHNFYGAKAVVAMSPFFALLDFQRARARAEITKGKAGFTEAVRDLSWRCHVLKLCCQSQKGIGNRLKASLQSAVTSITKGDVTKEKVFKIYNEQIACGTAERNIASVTATRLGISATQERNILREKKTNENCP